MIKFYVDGACSGNPGPGGYGVVALEENILFYSYSAKSEDTTNNREELKAILKAFEVIKESPIESAIVYSDSAYAVNMINDWIWTWVKNDWQNSKKKTVENIDLVKQIYEYIKDDEWRLNYSVEKISGHSGIDGNEMADALATNNINKFAKILAENYEDKGVVNLKVDTSKKI